MNSKAARKVRRYVAEHLGDVLDTDRGVTTASDGVSDQATAGQLAAVQRRAKAAYRAGGMEAVEDLVAEVLRLDAAGELEPTRDPDADDLDDLVEVEDLEEA